MSFFTFHDSCSSDHYFLCDMAGVPFKVCLPHRNNVTVGVVAQSYDHFREVLTTKLGLRKDFRMFMEDGTLVCDEDYFHLLEPQTKLTVVEPTQLNLERVQLPLRKIWGDCALTMK